MKALTVLYDGECGFCRFCVSWLARQPKFLALRFVAQQSEEVGARWPGLVKRGTPEEMVVVSDAGGVYRGEKAYIMVLYALRAWRGLSLRLATPGWRGLAKRAFRLVAQNRYRISMFVSHEALRERVRATAEVDCVGAACAVRRRMRGRPGHPASGGVSSGRGAGAPGPRALGEGKR